MDAAVFAAGLGSAPLSPLDLTTFALLVAAIAALWISARAWVALLAAATACGYLSGALTGLAAVWIALLALACVLYDKSSSEASLAFPTLKLASLAGIIILSLALALHLLPGFHNRPLIAGAILSPGAAAYDLWLNFDKTTAGLLVLGLTYHRLLRTRADWLTAIKEALIPGLLTILGAMGLALLLGFVRWAPKLTPQFWIWAIVNLAFTCVSEEAFFRAFIQVQLARALGDGRWTAPVTILTSAILFGLAHVGGGWTYVLLAAAAGLGYAITFHRSGRVEMSILTHFGLNTVHYLLFTYPYWSPR